MESFFIRSWWVLGLRGLAAILFGVLAFAWPGLTLLSLVALFAAFALVSGIASAIGAIRHRHAEDDWWVALLLGVVSIGAGGVALFNPALTALVLVLLIGANALVIGVLDILAAIRLRKAVPGEWMLALSGLASVVFGAIVFFFPGAGALALVWVVSVYAIVTGVLLLGLAVRMRTRAGKVIPVSGPERRVQAERRISPAR